MKSETDLALLILSAALFGIIAGTHAAMQVLSYSRLDKNGDDDQARKRFADRLLENPISNYFSLGLGRILSLALVTLTAYRFASDYLFVGQRLGLGHVLVVGGAVLVPFSVGTLVALKEPQRFADVFRFVTYPVIYILRPLVYPFVALARRASPRLLDILAFPALPLKKRIEVYGANGKEETPEQSLMSSIFEFGDTKVREVMVPRIDMVAINMHTDPDEALSIVIEAGHSRIPVFDESIDKIVGVIHTKDLLKKTVENKELSLADIQRDVYFVPESKKIDELLTEFKQRKIHIAIVVDEYGGTAGLITLEDVLEELVGDIQDEFDTEEELIKKLDDDSVLCNSRVHLDDLNEALGLDLPEGDVDTLGGFLYEMIGRVPRVGESFHRGELEFEIHSVARQRIDEVLIRGLRSLGRRVQDNIG